MLYYVQPGDSLYGIAIKFNVTIQDIIDANVICNPNLIFVGEPLIVPTENLNLPKAGGRPYYIVKPGDSLYCLANQFNTSINALAKANEINNPHLIYPETELLIAYDEPNAETLFNEWKSTGDEYCGEMSSLQIHGIYYIGTLKWEALQSEAIPYLTELLKHPCDVVRFYTALSMGRIADERFIPSLNDALSDPDTSVANMAALALERIKLVSKMGERAHVTVIDSPLLLHPISTSPSTELPEGTPIIALKWGIPSPIGEEGPIGDIQMFDYVQVLSTGQVGYLPRVGYSEIVMV